ncbi:RBBP6 ligase, partial [Pelecanoides urinatrix]|nr:RBBP6 ligase [Pelecanoides urinatrix]
EAYARGKKEKPPFLPEEPESSSSTDDPFPDELLCLICKEIMTDAVVIPCCRNSYCDECIRTALLESEEHTCPTCHQTDVSSDALIANKFLRKAVNNFKNGTGYTKRLHKQIQEQQQQQPPPPPPPLMRQTMIGKLQPLLRQTITRQQDPLMIPLASLASHSAAALSSLAPGQSSVAAGLPVNLSSVVVSDVPPAVSLPLRAEKPDGPFCDANTVIPPAALVTATELSKSPSLSISSLLEEKGCQVPVLRQPPLSSLLGPPGQSIPTTGHPMRASTICSAGGRPGWEVSSNRGRPHSERTQRTQAPTLPASAPVFVPVPPPPLYPPPPHALPLPPRVPPPQFPPQFPPGQPPSAGYTVPPPGYPPAPANMSSAWVPAAVPTAHSNTIPTTQAPPLSREFYREQQRLKKKEKKKSKRDEFTNDFAKELVEYKKIQKGRRHSFSRSKSPYSTSSYSRSSYTYSKSRSGSSCSCSYSQSFSHSHSHSYSQSPIYPRRDKEKSHNYRSRSRSHGYQHSRSGSPPYRRCHSWSRSPVFRGQSPTKRTIPQGEGERQYFNRYTEVPLYDMKAYYGRSVDFRDPFEKERYREWERNYREWYEKFYKGYAVGAQPRPPVNREDFSPGRFGPPGTRRENSPYARGHREDYPGGQRYRNHNIAGNNSEKPSGSESLGIKAPTKSKENEVENPLGDGKGNKHKKHRKRRKGDENERFPNAELLEGVKKTRESITAEDIKMGSLFMLPSRDEATPVRDEPTEEDSIAFKPVSEKEKKGKDKPKAKVDETKQKVEVAVPPKKDNIIKPAKTSQENVDTDCEKSLRMQAPVKKVKEELPKTENVKTPSSQNDEKTLGTPWKVHPKVTKDHPETRPAKEEKAKKDHPKETKSEKPSNKEDKSKKPAEKSKPSDAKCEKRKRKVDEEVAKEHEATSIKASKPETAESKTSPKGKTKPDGEKGERTPEKDKSAFLNNPTEKIKLNQETRKKIVSGEKVPPAKEPVEKPEPSSSKFKQEKVKGKVRRKVIAADGSSSNLVDYT